VVLIEIIVQKWLGVAPSPLCSRGARLRKLGYASCQINEVLVKLLEHEAEGEDALDHLDGQVVRQSLATRVSDRGAIGVQRRFERIERR
jgi:hypothetical protein